LGRSSSKVARQPGWQVLVLANPAAGRGGGGRARRGASYAVLRVESGDWRIPISLAWARESPDELLGKLAPIERRSARRGRAGRRRIGVL